MVLNCYCASDNNVSIPNNNHINDYIIIHWYNNLIVSLIKTRSFNISPPVSLSVLVYCTVPTACKCAHMYMYIHTHTHTQTFLLTLHMSRWECSQQPYITCRPSLKTDMMVIKGELVEWNVMNNWTVRKRRERGSMANVLDVFSFFWELVFVSVCLISYMNFSTLSEESL